MKAIIGRVKYEVKMSLAHERLRHSMPLLLKKINFSPIVSIQGPRQCGKSYLVRHLLVKKLPNCSYKSLDRHDLRVFAESNPRSFLEGHESKHLIIDEAQKSPQIFDEMKDIVDDIRTPGQFIILGSTEFSIETKIKESLTGRLSKLRLFPLSLSETLKFELNKKDQFPFINQVNRFSRKDFLRYLENGGMPGIFAVRNENERRSLISDWIKTTVDRDIHQIQKYKLDSQIAMKILSAVCTLETASCAEISSFLRMNSRTVQRYLHAFLLLFVIVEIRPTHYSSGKPLYYVTDCGISNVMGASFQKTIETWFYIELISQLSYKDFFNYNIQYYKSAKSSRVHAIYEDEKNVFAIKLNFNEKIDKRELLIFESLKKVIPKNKKLSCYYLSGGISHHNFNDIKIHPWESIC